MERILQRWGWSRWGLGRWRGGPLGPWGAAIACAALLGACSGTKVVAVKQADRDGNSEYWVCEGGEAKSCRGEQDGDIDPDGFQHRVQAVAPPVECQFGVANLDIVIDGNAVKRVRYECAQPATPTGLPPSTGVASGLPSSTDDAGLPPSTEESGADTGLPPSTEESGADTGLPPSTEDTDAEGGQ